MGSAGPSSIFSYHIAQINRAAILDGDHHLLQIGRGIQESAGLYLKLGITLSKAAGLGAYVRSLDRVRDFSREDSVCRQSLRIEHNSHRAWQSADDVCFGNVVDLLNGVFEFCGHLTQIGKRRSSAPTT